MTDRFSEHELRVRQIRSKEDAADEARSANRSKEVKRSADEPRQKQKGQQVEKTLQHSR